MLDLEARAAKRAALAGWQQLQGDQQHEWRWQQQQQQQQQQLESST